MNWGLSLSTSMRQMRMRPIVPATKVNVKMSSSQNLTSDSYSSSLLFTINTSNTGEVAEKSGVLPAR
jgi:hypothetical protein